MKYASSRYQLSPKDLARYNELRDQAMQDISDPRCLDFLLDKGIDPAQFWDVLKNQEAYNGSESTITQGDANVGMGGYSWMTVAQGFQDRPGRVVHAVASLNGTDVYFHKAGFLSSIFGNSYIRESVIEHEGLHNLYGIHDPGLQSLLGVEVNADDTSNIDKILKEKHCTK